MLPNTKPPNREWYLDRCAALAKTASRPEIYPPFLIASYCESVLIRIYGSPWRVIWLLIKDRLRSHWEHAKQECWHSWHTYVMQRMWLEKETGYDDREWPDEVEVDDEAEQHAT